MGFSPERRKQIPSLSELMKEGLPLFPEGYRGLTSLSLGWFLMRVGTEHLATPDIPSALGC